MGAWGTGPFANDGALDWLIELTTGDGLEPVTEAFVAVEASAGDYIEADLGEAAVAAAEVVARLLGRPGPAGDEEPELCEWLTAHSGLPVKRLTERALKVLGLLTGENSELRELWDEAEDTAWLAAIADLKSRLRGQ